MSENGLYIYIYTDMNMIRMDRSYVMMVAKRDERTTEPVVSNIYEV